MDNGQLGSILGTGETVVRVLLSEVREQWNRRQWAQLGMTGQEQRSAMVATRSVLIDGGWITGSSWARTAADLRWWY
jgi:hypothetical protein